MTVQKILTRKGSTVHTIESTATIEHAAKSLSNHRIGALVVTGAEGRTIGIISERDIVRAVSEKGSPRHAGLGGHDPRGHDLHAR